MMIKACIYKMKHLKKRLLLSLLLWISTQALAETAYLSIHNKSNSFNVGLYNRFYFIVQQVDVADNNGNYAAWLMSVPLFSRFNYAEYVISRDYLIWHDQQCLFNGKLTANGLELTQTVLGEQYFRCEIIGNRTKTVTINVYSN